ncbi:Wzt carbohydrate-binding domain-containing protein [Candidatus Sumerlaeota bacterium]|nr:Wzt carbohydrate-binding domain-containing protein [Candidatus Sumerlaeota bacterium]
MPIGIQIRPSRTTGSAGSVQTSQPGAEEGDATDELQSAPRTPGETESSRGAGSFQAEAGHRSGNFGAAITQVVVRSTGAGSNSSLLRPGMTAEIVVRAVALERVEHPTVGIQIKDRLGNEVYGINTHLRGIELGSLEPGQAVEVSFRGPINLGVGLYSVTAAIHRGDSHTEICYDWIERAATFQILPTPSERFTGVCRLELEIQHRPVESSEEELALAKTLRGD